MTPSAPIYKCSRQVWDSNPKTGEVAPMAGGKLVEAGQLPVSNVRTSR